MDGRMEEVANLVHAGDIRDTVGSVPSSLLNNLRGGKLRGGKWQERRKS